MERAQSMETAKKYAQDIIRKAIMLRDENSGNRNRSILKSAIEYIDTHYMNESLSLNTAAQVANISANHFSALFSQNMGQTFIEYLTALRMEHARELLRCTGKRSSEIAADVYKRQVSCLLTSFCCAGYFSAFQSGDKFLKYFTLKLSLIHI